MTGRPRASRRGRADMSQSKSRALVARRIIRVNRLTEELGMDVVEALEQLKRICDMAPRAQAFYWWGVGERMPDADITVMICAKTMDPPVWLGYFDGEKWLTVDGNEADVTHWADVPAPMGGD